MPIGPTHRLASRTLRRVLPTYLSRDRFRTRSRVRSTSLPPNTVCRAAGLPPIPQASPPSTPPTPNPGTATPTSSTTLLVLWPPWDCTAYTTLMKARLLNPSMGIQALENARQQVELG